MVLYYSFLKVYAMKRILLAFLLICCSAILKSQVPDTTKPVTPLQFNPDLLFHKATKQKNIAWILLGMGAGLNLAGYIIAVKSMEVLDFDSPAASAGAVLSLVGTASMIASIPFFISPGKKRKQQSYCLEINHDPFPAIRH